MTDPLAAILEITLFNAIPPYFALNACSAKLLRTSKRGITPYAIETKGGQEIWAHPPREDFGDTDLHFF
jgi:hypothetical protein